MSQDHKTLWRPKFCEMPEQCASCPFRIGNNAEFGAVVERLRAAEGIVGTLTKKIVGFARTALWMDAVRTGDFMCHCTVYDANMQIRPMADWRQCKGATHVYRTGTLPPKS